MSAEWSCTAEVWGKMAVTAVVLLNRLPNTTIGDDMPYYRMFGKHVDLSFLPTIGARDFVHNEGHLRKLDPRAREGVLIGCDDDKPTYIIYFRETGQVTSTRNVAFMEVPPAAISTATGAEGRNDDDDDDTLVYENCNLDIINDDTNDCFFDGITDLKSAAKTDSVPLGSTWQLRLLAAAGAVPTGSAPAAQQPSTTGAATPAAGTARKFQTSSGLNQARALRQLALATYFAAR